VQGVGFRYFLREKGEELHLTGVVKNMQDGSVFVLAEGREENLQQFIEFAREGNDYTKIDKFNAQWEAALGEFINFDIF
jgi:acylphosphatase